MPVQNDSPPSRYAFLDLTLDVARRRVERNGEALELNTLSFDLLSALVRAAPDTVTYDELAKTVWQRAFVSQEAIAQRVKLLRRCLSESGRRPRYIEAVRRRGYRLIPPVRPVRVEVEDASASRPVAPRLASSWWTRVGVAAAGVLAIAVATGWALRGGWLGDEPSAMAAAGGPSVAAPDRDQESRSDERRLDDIFAVPDELAASVAPALEVTSGANASGAPRSAAAYDHYLQARFFFNRRAPGDLERAATQYEQALAIDPSDAAAWAGLAGVFLIQVVEGSIPREPGLAKVADAARTALGLAPDQPEALVRLGNYAAFTGDVAAAREHYRRAAAVAADHPLVLAITAKEAFLQGRLDEALDLQGRAVSADPLNVVARHNLAAYLYHAGRLDEALAQLRVAEDIDRDPSRAAEDAMTGFILVLQRRFDEALDRIQRSSDEVCKNQGLAMVYHMLGREAEAADALERLLASPLADAAISLAEIYAYRGQREEAFRWLDAALRRAAAYTAGASDGERVLEARFSPFFRPLHDDPRWERWVAEVDKLAGYSA